MSLSSPLLPANPNTLTNGTPADATQVMANFNNIVNNINALLNSTTGAGYVGITSDTRWGGGASVQDALSTLIDKQQLSDTGSVNALVITPAGSLFTANVASMRFLVKPGNTTTNNTPTLKVGTAPALTIVNGDGSAHIPGSIQANRPAEFWIDTVNSQAVLLNPYAVNGSATITQTGYASNPTGTLVYFSDPYGRVITFYTSANITGTSNATTMTWTGIPTILQSTNTKVLNTAVQDAGTLQQGTLFISPGSVWTWGKGINVSGGFTNTGTKATPGNYEYVFNRAT